MTEQTVTESTEVPTADPNPELTAYKAQVRDMALALKRRFEWCDEETNHHLEALGLEPIPAAQNYVFRVATTGTIFYQVRAISAEDAQAAVERQVSADRARLERNIRGNRTPEYGIVEKVELADVITAAGSPQAEDVSF